MKTLIKILTLSLLGFFSSCNQDDLYKEFVIKGTVFGSNYSIKYYDKFFRSQLVKEQIQRRLKEIDLNFSTYSKNSLVSKINANTTVDAMMEINEEFYNVLALSKMLNKVTENHFNPLIGSLVKKYGFDKTDKNYIESKETKDLSLFSFEHIDFLQVENKYFVKKRNEFIQFDFNALVPGYAVEQLGKMLEGLEIENYLIDIGGELRAVGHKIIKNEEVPWVVGVEVPSEIGLNQFISKVQLKDMGIATSGNYRKYVIKDNVKIGHTISPKTGTSPSSNIVSVTVIAESTANADAWATALMAMGKEKAMKILAENEMPLFYILADKDGLFEVKKNELFEKYLKKD